MDNQIKLAFEKSKSGDKDKRYEAYQNILNATIKKLIGLTRFGVN